MPKIVEFRTDPRFVRRAREIHTIELMITSYCRGHHDTQDADLCAECASLSAYATRRTERCVFGDAKPTCANCQVHCYTPRMRERVKAVMRWAGPRMLLTHPILALRHKLDGLKPAPRLPADPRASAKT
jgi:hypothetical protein